MKLFFIAIMLFSASAQAVDIDAAIGRAHFERSDNGTWWQTPFAEQWPQSTASWSLGISDELTPSLRWTAGYANLGVIESYGEAVGDEIWSATNGCTTGPCPAPDKWYGKGSVDGVYFTIAPQMTRDNITYSAEIGAWNYQPISIVYVPMQTAVTPTRVQAYFITSSNRVWGQVFGLGVRYKQVFARWRLYWVDADDREYPATFQKYAHEIAVGWVF